jgi:hypothetical protein
MPQSLVLSDSTIGRVDAPPFVFVRSLTNGALDRPIRTCLRTASRTRSRKLTALVPEIEQIPHEARFSCPYE